MASMDRDPRIGRRLKQLLLDNRYRDVDVEVVQLHIGGWSPGKASLLHLVSCLLLWPVVFRHS
jgi:hypothetical protein